MALIHSLAGILLVVASCLAKEFHYGAAFGPPFDVSTDCTDINLISPELLLNWGNDNRHDGTLDVCGNPAIHYVPNQWGRASDNAALNALPNSRTPWGVIFENEPNWWGPQPLTASHGDGCNMTAREAASRYHPATDTINRKWGVGVVKLISPSPVNKFYPNCSHEPSSNCAFQPQYAWFNEYFANCGTCFHDTWALNLHDYSCNLASTKSLVADMNAVYPNKNIFFGEIGCNGPTADQMAQYLEDFVAWAYGVPTIVGFIWSAINSVGTKGSELSLNGQLQPVGRAFKDIQNRYPPKLTP